MRDFIPFPNPKVYVKVWLEFELAYYDVAVKHISYYVIKIPPCGASHGVMGTVEGNGHGDTSSNPGPG